MEISNREIQTYFVWFLEPSEKLGIHDLCINLLIHHEIHLDQFNASCNYRLGDSCCGKAPQLGFILFLIFECNWKIIIYGLDICYIHLSNWGSSCLEKVSFLYEIANRLPMVVGAADATRPLVLLICCVLLLSLNCFVMHFHCSQNCRSPCRDQGAPCCIPFFCSLSSSLFSKCIEHN